MVFCLNSFKDRGKQIPDFFLIFYFFYFLVRAIMQCGSQIFSFNLCLSRFILYIFNQAFIIILGINFYYLVIISFYLKQQFSKSFFSMGFSGEKHL